MCKTHSFTVRWLFDCELCNAPVSTDDIGYDGENNWCPNCVDAENEASAVYWIPPIRSANP